MSEELSDLAGDVVGSEPELSPLQTVRHSCAHVMAKAVQKLFPGTKVTIGPDIDSGFYYDFDAPKTFTEDDLVAIEAEMKAIIKNNEPFERCEVSRAEAHKLFEDLGETYNCLLYTSPSPRD